MAEDEEEVSGEDLDVLADAVGGGEGEDLDPLAGEMLNVMEEEGDSADAGSQEDVDRMMEMEMLKAMEDDGSDGGDLSSATTGGGGAAMGIPANIARLMDVNLSV